MVPRGYTLVRALSPGCPPGLGGSRGGLGTPCPPWVAALPPGNTALLEAWPRTPPGDPPWGAPGAPRGPPGAPGGAPQGGFWETAGGSGLAGGKIKLSPV